jgi:hypothetical protein
MRKKDRLQNCPDGPSLVIEYLIQDGLPCRLGRSHLEMLELNEKNPTGIRQGNHRLRREECRQPES